jgi:hypothetical protein
MLPDTLNNFDEFLVYDYEAVVSNLLVHLTTNVLANECCYYCLLQCWCLILVSLLYLVFKSMIALWSKFFVLRVVILVSMIPRLHWNFGSLIAYLILIVEDGNRTLFHLYSIKLQWVFYCHPCDMVGIDLTEYWQLVRNRFSRSNSFKIDLIVYRTRFRARATEFALGGFEIKPRLTTVIVNI